MPTQLLTTDWVAVGTWVLVLLAIVSIVLGLWQVSRRQRNRSQRQRAGKGSTNLQAGRDIRTGQDSDSDD